MSWVLRWWIHSLDGAEERIAVVVIVVSDAANLGGEGIASRYRQFRGFVVRVTHNLLVAVDAAKAVDYQDASLAATGILVAIAIIRGDDLALGYLLVGKVHKAFRNGNKIESFVVVFVVRNHSPVGIRVVGAGSADALLGGERLVDLCRRRRRRNVASGDVSGESRLFGFSFRVAVVGSILVGVASLAAATGKEPGRRR